MEFDLILWSKGFEGDPVIQLPYVNSFKKPAFSNSSSFFVFTCDQSFETTDCSFSENFEEGDLIIGGLSDLGYIYLLIKFYALSQAQTY